VRQRPLRVAIEGPCCAGKTTMEHALRQALRPRPTVSVLDYSDVVGGGRNLPPAVPVDLREERETLATFLAIERERTADARSLRAANGVILIDRSVHTLLAHCFALTLMTGIDYRTLAGQVIESSPVPLWPDLIIHLDVTQETVHARNRGKFSPDSIFINPRFNEGLRAYFRSPHRDQSPAIACLDGGTDARLLHARAAEYIVKSLSTHSDDGEARCGNQRCHCGSG
jgi:thymidylate kinase